MSDIWDSIKEFFSSLLEFIIDVFFMILDAIVALAFDLFDELIAQLDFIDIKGLVDAMPEQLVQIMSVLHVNECMSLLIAALIIRFFLQLIPFVRLGS